MVRRLSYAIILCTILIAGGVMAQSTHVWRPSGTLLMHADGAEYLVGDRDNGGQWQVAWGNPHKWVLLKAANPQLEDPDLIRPGFRLNVPPELIADFVAALSPNAVHTEVVPSPADSGSKNPPPVVAETSHFPFWVLWLLLAAFIAFLIYWYARSRERTASDRYYGGRIQGLQEQAGEADRRERARVLADPYAGPPVVEGGLPTPELAMEHFTRGYQEERNRMTVAQSAQLAPRVSVDRIVPVWVRGEMGVRQGGSSTPVRKVLERREPAWRAYLSDGSSRITLWRCGNDVYAGNGYDILPETQIEERTDLPSYTPAVPQQVWPEVAPATPTEVPAQTTTSVPATLEFASVRFDGPQRLVLQPGGQVLDFGPLAAQGVRIAVGVQNGEVIVDNNGQRVVYGRIVGEQPAQVVLPAETGAAGADGSSRDGRIEEIVAAAGPQS